jgi:hypothetical protein
MDRIPEAIGFYQNVLHKFFDTTINPDNFQLVIWVVIVLLLLLPAVVRIVSTIGGQNIAFRRKMTVTIWMAIFAAVMMIFGGDILYHNLIFIPAAGMVAYQLHGIKKSAWNEIVILALLVLSGVHNYLDR